MSTGKTASAAVNIGVVFRRSDCAGFWLRILVDAIDFVVAATAVAVLSIPQFLISTGDARFQIQMVFSLVLVVWLVYFVFLKYWSRTVGYRLCRVRLVNLQGQPPSLWEVFTRSMFAFFGPVNVVIDLIWLSGDPYRQALRDKFAHTYVVRREAEPLATGPIRYARYTIMAANLQFQEVHVKELS